MKKENFKILFVVNGMGLGNSTRCYPIMQELSENGAQIFVATSGNGLSFFENKPEVQQIFSLEPMTYGFSKSGDIKIGKTLQLLPKLFYRHFKNEKQINKLISQLKPFAIVTDSQYLISSMALSKIPVFAINNSSEVLKYFYKKPPAQLDLHAHLLLFELSDYLYHRFFIKRIFTPSIPDSTFNSQANSLLVRRGIQGSQSSNPRRALVMLSGATGDTCSWDPSNWSTDLEIDVIGITGKNKPGLNYHGKITDNLELLNNTDILVINGGFSSISEAIALKKPAVVVPIEGHSEQYVNAKRFTNLGLGLIATHRNVEIQLREILKNYSQFLKAYEHLQVDTAGAKIVADNIISHYDFC